MDAYGFLANVREKRPLVHHITNWVTISDCAQVVKSLGASPVMAHAAEEVEEMCGLASALVLNIGTLTREIVDSMKVAACAANKRKIPVILDVCGAGATSFRDRTCIELLDTVRIDVVKGNRSEIARVAGRHVHTRGVDSLFVTGDLGAIASELARKRGCTVVMTGAEDIVADSGKTLLIRNGVDQMATVVGTGCMAASVIGAFAGASPEDPTLAAAAALSCFGIAAELAAVGFAGPMAFKQQILDNLYALDRTNTRARQRIVE